jgi:ferrous iron transport protein B
MLLDNITSEKHCSFEPRTLDTLERGSRCVVTSVSSSNVPLRNKLLSMGIVAGTTVELAAVAPLGDPVTIKALGYSLSLRIAEAKEVQVMPVTTTSNQHSASNQRSAA